MQVITLLVFMSHILLVFGGKTSLTKALIYSSAVGKDGGNYTQTLSEHVTGQPSLQQLKDTDSNAKDSSAQNVKDAKRDKGGSVHYEEMAPVLEMREEWEQWQVAHGKKYLDVREMVESHSVWMANREYIEQHNTNAQLFGYSLRMNQFGDLVSMIFECTSLYRTHTCKHLSCFHLA